QGESLSLLVLYKLPFQVPSEPTVEAYIEKLEKQNKNSFMHYSLPNALLKMRQGFGRLIRSKDDNGVVLILDNRIKLKQYGKYFEQILPTNIRFMQNPEQTLSNIKMWFEKIK
nr:helicase C-terminal domain-containing protein [Candidatus Cloacimonadota bacterium]